MKMDSHTQSSSELPTADSSPDVPRPRLSTPFSQRLPLATLLSSIAGASLGVSHGAMASGLRFRAENAHRLPSSATGWYLYHKSKNYNIMFGGVVEGFKMGAKVALLVGGFFTVEEAVDRLRGTEDFLSTIVAGGGMSGVWSLWSKWLCASQRSFANPGLCRSISVSDGGANSKERVTLWAMVRTCPGCCDDVPGR